MKKKVQAVLKRSLSVLAAIVMAVSMLPAAAYAEDTPAAQDTGYQLEVAVTGAEAPLTVGDTVTLTAEVTYNGETITDLQEAGLQLWFWADVWTQGKTDEDGYSLKCSYSNYDGTNGHSLSADVTFDAAAKFSIAAELKKDGVRTAIVTNDFTVSEAPEQIVEPTKEIALDNADFESGDTAGWTITPEKLEVKADQHMTNNMTDFLNLWVSDDAATDLSAAYTIAELPAGTYRVKIDAQGEEEESGLSLYVADENGNLLTGKTAVTTTGWDKWTTFQTDIFTLEEPTTVVVTVAGTTPAGYWGGLDNLVLLGNDNQEEEDTSIPAEIEVEKVKNLSEDFIMGMDISTIVSQYNSGVTYTDFDGTVLSNVTEFCQFLSKDCGINSVRVRVWNDPYDAEGHGYGAGNCDVETAAKIAEACAAADIHMMVDFHYSDFWADPGKQREPKAWEKYTIEQKEKAVYDFTLESLKTIAATGVKISMVQVGNETNSGVCGESSTENMCRIFTQGSAAVRAFSTKEYGDEKAVKIAIHLANPHRGAMTLWAKNLQDNNVDYDVIATSYYVFWHGTLANLKSEIKKVQDTYGKDVVVAETSYIYTADDTDGKGNGISVGIDGYDVSPQGQASVVRDIIDAVNSAGGLGVYYWEPAWITVGDIRGLEGDELAAQIAANQEKWETYGSGWASSYVIGYDTGASLATYGGSEWDNQAMFDAAGKPLSSLHVWNYVKTGAVMKDLYVSNVASPALKLYKDESAELPDTVSVTYNKPSVGTIDEPVTWDEEDLAAIDFSKPGIYKVHGTVTLTQECTDGAAQADAVCTVTVLEGNLITDEAAAGFETAEPFTVSGKGVKLASNEDVLAGEKTLHWYSASATESSVTYNELISLKPGYYTFETVAMGAVGDEIVLSVSDKDGNVLFQGEPTGMGGYTVEPDKFVVPSVTFELEEDTDVKLCVTLKIADGGWGSTDSMYLRQHEAVSGVSCGEGTHMHDLICEDCGVVLETEAECTYELTESVEPGKEDGYKVYTCSVCGDSYRETVPKTEPSENPSDPTKPTKPTDSTNSSEQQTKPTGDVKKTDTVKTGDNSPWMIYSIAAVGALAVIVSVIAAKKRRVR